MDTLKSLLFVVLLLSAGIGTQAQTYVGKQKDIDQILRNVEQFSADYVAGDYDAIADAYTEDGKIFPNNSDIIEGRAAIHDRWVLPAGVKTLRHKVTPEEIRIVKKYAYDYGYYEGATHRADGSESSWKGKYVIIWRKVGKDWKIYLDIWNRIKE